ISHPPQSAIYAEFNRLLMGNRGTTAAARIVPSQAAMLATVRETPGSVGYVNISNITTTVRAVAIDDIQPTPENIANSTYPLRSTIYIASVGEPTGSYRTFIGWLQSPDGQQVVAQRHVPINQP
ncbi:MAG: hypothetical protein AAF125_14830, partial [Chloroflexota bacterium]